MIEITIKTLDSQNHNFSVEENITVRELKETIAESVNVPANSQRLIYFGRVLTDEKKLSEYDVNGKVIHLVQRAPPSSLRNRSGGTGESQSGRDGGGRSPSGLTYMGRFGRHGESNATYLGAMAFPADLMDPRGLAPRPPTRRLTPYRLAIAESMLNLAERSMTNLENGPAGSNADPPDQSGNASDPSNATSSTASAMESMPCSSLPDGINGNLTKDSLPPEPAFKSEPLEVDISGQNETDPKTDSNETDDKKVEEDKKPEASASDDMASVPSTSGTLRSQSAPNIPRRISSCNLQLAAAIHTLLNITNRLTPRLEEYQRIVADESPTLNARSAQHTFDCVSEVMHSLAHAYHSLSDLMCDFSQPAPRPIVCRPVLIRHSAVVQTGIPIQMINVSRSPRQSSTTTRETSTPANSANAGTNTSAQTVNDASTQRNGVPPAAQRNDGSSPEFAAATATAQLVAAAADEAAQVAGAAANVAASAAASAISAAIRSAVAADAPGVVHVHLDPLDAFAALIADSYSSSRPANTNTTSANSTSTTTTTSTTAATATTNSTTSASATTPAPPSTENTGTEVPRAETPRRSTPPNPAELVTTGTTTSEENPVPNTGRGTANRSRNRIRSTVRAEDALANIYRFFDVQNLVQRTNSNGLTTNTNGSTNTNSSTTNSTGTNESAANGPGLTRVGNTNMAGQNWEVFMDVGLTTGDVPPGLEGATGTPVLAGRLPSEPLPELLQNFIRVAALVGVNNNNSTNNNNNNGTEQREEGGEAAATPPRSREGASQNAPTRSSTSNTSSQSNSASSRMHYVTSLSPTATNDNNNEFDPFLPCNSEHVRRARDLAPPIINPPRVSDNRDALLPFGYGRVNEYLPGMFVFPAYGREYDPRTIPRDVANRLRTRLGSSNITTFTVTELLLSISNFYRPGESIVMDVVMTAGRYVTVEDLLNPQRLSRASIANMRPSLMGLLKEYFNMEIYSDVAVEAAIDKINLELKPFIRRLFNPGTVLGQHLQGNVDLEASISKVVQHFVPMIVKDIIDGSVQRPTEGSASRNGEGPSGSSSARSNSASANASSNPGSRRNTSGPFRTVTFGFLQQPRFRPDHSIFDFINALTNLVFLCCKDISISEVIMALSIGMSTYVDQFAQRWFLSELGCWFVRLQPNHEREFCSNFCRKYVVLKSQRTPRRNRDSCVSVPVVIEEIETPLRNPSEYATLDDILVSRQSRAAPHREASVQPIGIHLSLDDMIAAHESRAAPPRESSGQARGLHTPTIPPRETPEEPLAEVVLESESWDQSVPPDWVPIITRDKREQRRAAAQGPLSDSYLSGMPSKRRKIVTSAKPHHTLSKAITESMSVALGAAGIAGNGVDGVAENAAGDVDLRSAFKEQLRTSVESTLRSHPDFTPDKYPNAAKYFNPPPRHQ